VDEFSYGILFLKTLLRASELDNDHWEELPDDFSPLIDMIDFEHVEEETFNIRDETRGINTDLMSYSMYALANQNPEALLDPRTYLNLTQRVFSTFFQHYVSRNYSYTDGGFAYQKIGSRLADLGMPLENDEAFKTYTDMDNNTIVSAIYPILNTSRTVDLVVCTRIDVLRMKPVATWLSIGILIWLMVTTLILAAVQRRYLKPLPRNIETLADVLLLIAGSDNFLKLVAERGVEGLMNDQEVLTRLGWFVDSEGKTRWGLEVFGGDGAVEWVDGKERMGEEEDDDDDDEDEEKEVRKRKKKPWFWLKRAPS